MWVIVHLSRYYDWDPVPPGVVLTKEDIAGPLVIPGRNAGEYRMRVEKPGPTYRTVHIAESTIVAKIIDEKVDVRRSGHVLTRRQAVAHVVRLALDNQAQWSWVTKFEVHDDGPSEELMRSMLEPHTKSIHGRTGRVHVHESEVEAHVKAYVEHATKDHHVEHLHAHFGVPVPAKETSP